MFLDASRFGAALVVLLHHVLTPPFHDGHVGVPARTAVILFFVISGYVIAYVTDVKENDWRAYATSRLTRLYSVVVPAMALTAILFAIGRYAELPLYQPMDHPVARVLVSLAFQNHWWNLTVQALNNGPFWSLSYEFWYYVIFAAFVFLPRNLRWSVAAALLLFAGPRIAMLFPIWLVGVVAYRWSKRFDAGRVPGASFIFLACLAYTLGSYWLGTPFDSLAQSFRESLADGYLIVAGFPVFIGSDWSFLRDYWLGAVFAVAILFSSCRANIIPEVPPVAIFVREAAAYTFSLYLYHAPILFLIAALGLKFYGVTPSTWILVGTTLLAVWALGTITERRKGAYKRVFAKLLQRADTRVPVT